MALFSPQQQQQQPPQPQPEAEVEDFAFADSFLNFDYVPDMPPQNSDNNNGSDPIVFWSGSARVVEEQGPEPECVKLGVLGCCGGIEEGIEKISLVGGCGIDGNGGNGDDEDKGHHESESSESGSSSSSSSSTSSATSSDSSDGKEEERDDEKSELEEGEIVESDAVDGDGDDDDCDGDDDDDDGIRAVGGPITSKNELEILLFVPPVNVTLEPRHQMLPVGVVMSVLGAQVIVEGVEKHDPLNEGSILWMTESRTPLGLIDEIFGPVRNPYYIVRYNSEDEVPKGIHGGTLISFVPEFANHVLNGNEDLYKKGYDASGLNDEEVSDEADFSDDEKEAEHERKQRMTKRGINDQNPGRRKNKGKKFPPREGVVPTFPIAPASPLHDHGHCSTFSINGQGPFGAATVVPPFSPANAAPNLTPSGVWTDGATLPQPQSAVLPNGFPTNGMSWFPTNTQISHQWPVPGVPFEQQLSQMFSPATMFPGTQPNILAQLIYARGLGGQNQMTFGLNSPFPQIQPPICAGQQFPSSDMQSETNRNLASSSVPFHHQAPHQFHPGASANHGRRTFHPGRRKGWRPAK